MKAKIRIEAVEIPTYEIGAPEKCPMFIEKKAYQGSTGKVYPLPVIEKINDEKVTKKYNAIILENDFIYVMILPELGGRIQRAYDKTNGYDFVYYNEVIKPALVGLAGPWISGGIEFNWPQHHRPSTYSPVDYDISENEDGSVTAYIGETDIMYGTKAMAKITIYPDKSYIEIKGQLFNPTNLPQTFLWWANPAVAVNDDTFSVFPPDVNAVYDHGKRDVSTFPIATGVYYKADYTAGVDISRYKNIKVPTSYMAASSDFDFIGNYDEGKKAGLIHIADHHVSPGKKQWTWGCGDFGKMWDKNLTDENGPYIELMTGVFTDNQPDFTWLKPQEEKSFTQYFMPYKEVGRVSNATKDVVIGVEANTVKIYSSGVFMNSLIQVKNCGNIIYSEHKALSPNIPIILNFDSLEDYAINVSCDGDILCECEKYISNNNEVPNPAQALKSPQDIESLEELYLAATHLEQYRHATYNPSDYYLEGLKRDSTDIRLNNGYGLYLLRNGSIKESVSYFKAAIDKQIWRNPNPYSGECYYNLGLAYELLGENEKAYDAFFKSTWSAEVQSQGFYHLSCLCVKMGDYKKALEHINSSLVRNYHNMKARGLKAELLSILGADNEEFIEESINIDRLSLAFMNMVNIELNRDFNYLTLAGDYIEYGLYEKAIEILNKSSIDNPMINYYIGYCYMKLDSREKAMVSYQLAENQSYDYIFPNSLTDLIVLENVIENMPSSAVANYLLGNLYFDKKQYDKAKKCFENTIYADDAFSMAYRNLSILYYNKYKQEDKALEYIFKACELDKSNTRFILERDQLLSRLNSTVDERLRLLEECKADLEGRDVLYLSYISLLNQANQYEKAYDLISNHIFHPWEGGEGKVSRAYKQALFGLADIELGNKNYNEAIKYAQMTFSFPDSLGEGKLENVTDNQGNYFIAKCYEALGDNEKAKEYFIAATEGSSLPEMVRYYNDQPSDYIYYQGLAYYALGDIQRAKECFENLIRYCEKHVDDNVEYDFFAVSMPQLEVYEDDINRINKDYCMLLKDLGEKGLKEIKNEKD